VPYTRQHSIKLKDFQDLFETQAREIKLRLKQISIRIGRVELTSPSMQRKKHLFFSCFTGPGQVPFLYILC